MTRFILRLALILFVASSFMAIEYAYAEETRTRVVKRSNEKTGKPYYSIVQVNPKSQK